MCNQFVLIDDDRMILTNNRSNDRELLLNYCENISTQKITVESKYENLVINSDKNTNKEIFIDNEAENDAENKQNLINSTLKSDQSIETLSTLLSDDKFNQQIYENRGI